MAKKSIFTSKYDTPKKHIQYLIEWMSHGVYEKEQIISMALLCAIAGENMFLIGPPGTAKSMVASRLKMIFKDGKSFDYLMSRFSTPDEIFGPISISRLKNDDLYERLTTGYLPEADVVFLDEIWKAGPSIQNTLLTVINEHIFHNGGRIIHTLMKVLIAASNELPAKDEGLEALWDRFLVRMVSNCIESDSAFFKMIKGVKEEMPDLPEHLCITNELYDQWQQGSKKIDMQESVVSTIKALRKSLDALEREDGNQLRYYVSDRRWRKAYRLMQTSAYLNGRDEIDLSDYLLLIHSFWNDVDCIPNVLNAFTSSIADKILKGLSKIDRTIRQIMTASQNPQSNLHSAPNTQKNEFKEYDYFYYLVENYPAGDTYFSKWDYMALSNQARDGVRFYDNKKNKFIIHALIPGRPFDSKSQNATNLTKVKIQKFSSGAIIDGTPYSFQRKSSATESSVSPESILPVYQQVLSIQELFKNCVVEWEHTIATLLKEDNNIFLSSNDMALVKKMIKDVDEQIKATEVKLTNISMMLK